MKKLMNRDEAAAHLGLNARTVYALVRRGEVPATRVGRVLKFDPQQLDAWRSSRTTGARERIPEPLTAPPVDVGAWTDLSIDTRLLGALLAEQREVRRALARLSNQLIGGQR